MKVSASTRYKTPYSKSDKQIAEDGFGNVKPPSKREFLRSNTVHVKRREVLVVTRISTAAIFLSTKLWIERRMTEYLLRKPSDAYQLCYVPDR